MISLGPSPPACTRGNPAQETDADKNRHSLAVGLPYGSSPLLTGDMDASREAGSATGPRPGDLAGIQVLKAAHHGSDTSSSPEFLDRLGPKLVLVSPRQWEFSPAIRRPRCWNGCERGAILETGR